MSVAKAYQVLVHLASWLAFFLFVLMLSPKPHFELEMPKPPFPTFFLILFPALAVFYYSNKVFFIPKLLANQKRTAYRFAIGISVFTILAIPFIDNELIISESNTDPDVLGVNTLITLLLFMAVFITSSGQAIVKHWFSAETRKKEMEFEKTVTELSFLKSQINPHFLFNTLNNIYTLSILKSDKAPDAILKLADMMRYVLTDVGEKEAPVEQEIEYIEKFIALQKMRLTNTVEVDFKIFGKPDGQKIAPLLLMPFVENAFKFGVSTREKSSIKIALTLKKKDLTFQVENTVFKEKISKMLSTGTGLKNVKRRLELLYPKNHWIRTEEINSKFFVDLNIEF
jgi:two-component system LytT family sensor kinase